MQKDSLWQAVLGEIELSISRGNFLTWFKNTELLNADDSTIIIGVPNVFIKQQLERKYNPLISSLLEKNGLSPKSIEYKIRSMNIKPSYDDPVVFGKAASLEEEVPKLSGSSLAHSYRQGLNERYTFDNFVVGASNELAFAACQAITQTPGKKYNPLFLYGGVGIGKTHLIQAVGNKNLISG